MLRWIWSQVIAAVEPSARQLQFGRPPFSLPEVSSVDSSNFFGRSFDGSWCPPHPPLDPLIPTYTQRHACVHVLGMWDSEPKLFTEGDWDYVDFEAQIHPESDAKSFGGVSGGGLWRVQMYTRPDADEITSTIALEGVAFWEMGTSEGKGVVRCHGVASVRKVLESA
jgi:hypothetical protein